MFDLHRFYKYIVVSLQDFIIYTIKYVCTVSEYNIMYILYVVINMHHVYGLFNVVKETCTYLFKKRVCYRYTNLHIAIYDLPF